MTTDEQVKQLLSESAGTVPLGSNIRLIEADTFAVIVIDLAARLGKSKSGKTTIIATTNGNKHLPGHGAVVLGLNCYIQE